jgi:hypothetical protein
MRRIATGLNAYGNWSESGPDQDQGRGKGGQEKDSYL